MTRKVYVLIDRPEGVVVDEIIAVYSDRQATERAFDEHPRKQFVYLEEMPLLEEGQA